MAGTSLDKPGHVDLAPRNSVGNDPKWQLTARSELDVAKGLRLTLDARSVAAIKQTPAIPGYTELGGQLSFSIGPKLELFVAGRNLLHDNHAESNDFSGQLPSRSLYAGARSRF